MRSLLRGKDFAAQTAMLAPAPVQRKARGTANADVQAAAVMGTSGTGSAMPHRDVIQQGFGGYDISNVQAHTDAWATHGARAMGAEAYATGNRVAFDGAPSLHTAAHEAAHIVQQRAGVTPAGGVGQSGDPLEQHADAVADKIVAGESAEALLGEVAGAQRATTEASAVQRKEAGRGGLTTTDATKQTQPREARKQVDTTPVSCPPVVVPTRDAPTEDKQVIRAGLEIKIALSEDINVPWSPEQYDNRVWRDDLIAASGRVPDGWRSVAEDALVAELSSGRIGDPRYFEHFLRIDDKHQVYPNKNDVLRDALAPSLERLGHTAGQARDGYGLSVDAQLVDMGWKARQLMIQDLNAGTPTIGTGSVELLVSNLESEDSKAPDALETALRAALEHIVSAEKTRFDVDRATVPDDESLVGSSAFHRRLQTRLDGGENLGGLGRVVEAKVVGFELADTVATLHNLGRNILEDTSGEDAQTEEGLKDRYLEIPPVYHVTIGGSPRRHLIGVCAELRTLPETDLSGVTALTFGPFVSAVTDALAANPESAAEKTLALAEDLNGRMQRALALKGDTFRGFTALGLTAFLSLDPSEASAGEKVSFDVVGWSRYNASRSLRDMAAELGRGNQDLASTESTTGFIGDGSLVAATSANDHELAYETSTEAGQQGVFSGALGKELNEGDSLAEATKDAKSFMNATSLRQNPQLVTLLATTRIERPDSTPRSIHIGNDAYPRAPLNGAVNDAKNLAGAYQSRGYAPATVFDAPAGAIQSAFSSLVGGAQRGDRIALTFAGHGRQTGGLIGVDDVDVPWGEVAGYGSAAVAKGAHLELVIDACHSGALARSIEAAVHSAMFTVDALDSTRVRALRETVAYVSEAVRTALGMPKSYWKLGLRNRFAPMVGPLLHEARLDGAAFGEALALGPDDLKRWYDSAKETLAAALRRAIGRQAYGPRPRGSMPVPAAPQK